MKRYIKITILIILFIFFTLSTSAVQAVEKDKKDEEYELDDVISSGQAFIGAGQADGHQYVNQRSLKTASDNIYNTFLVIGIILAAIIGSVLAIQFMISGIEGKVKVKEALIPYVIGCIIIFGAFGIWKLSINIFKGIDDKLPATKSVQQTEQNGGSTTHESSSGATHGGSSGSF